MGLLITEPNMKGKIRRRRLGTMKKISSQSGFVLFRCHSTVYLRERERERKNKNATQLRIGMKRENVRMKNA